MPPTVLEQTLAQLWRALRDPGASSEVVSSLLAQLNAFLAQEDAPSLAAERCRAGLAHVLCELAERSSDETLQRKALGTLCEVQPQGSLLAAGLHGSTRVPERQIRHVHAKLPAHLRLGVANRILARPRHADPKTALWAAEEVHTIQSEDPEETLVFLEGLARSGERPSYPVQRELVHGRFGFWLQELMGLALDDTQAKYLVETAALLEWRPLGGRLPLLLKHVRPCDMPDVFRAVGRPDVGGGERTVKAALLFLKHKDAGARLAAAGTLVDLRSTKAAPALAFLCADPALLPRAVGQALRLEAADFTRMVKVLPAPKRALALGVALSLLARLLPDATNRAVQATAALGRDKPPLARAGAAMAEFIKGCTRTVPKPAFVPAPPAPYRQPEDKGGSLLGKVRQLLGSGGGAPRPGDGQAQLNALEPGAAVDGKTLRDAEAPGKNLSKIVFKNTVLRSLDLTQAVLGGTRFTACKLVDLDLSAARFKDVVFQDCEFTGCRLSGAALESVVLRGCVLRRVHLDAASAAKLRTERCRFEGCLLWGLRAEWWTARQCAFSACDFSRAALTGADLDGVCFTECLFLSSFAADSRLMNSRTLGCIFNACVFTGLMSDDPAFLEWEERSRRVQAEDAAAREQPRQPPAVLADDTGMRAMLQAVESILAERDLARRRRLALAANRRRLDWCAAKLGPLAAGVVDMLPGLLERGAVRTDAGLTPAPACVIEGYSPDLDTLELLDAHFESAPGGDKQAATPSLRVEALYSIGSVGTIAQGRGSDIDMWVCFDQGATDPKALETFRRKLAAIENWADRTHGLELHFFLTDLAKVRENNFGFSDKESAGSSQALLLKEEFYRTAVLLAGRKLAWWLAPVGATGADYRRTLARIARAGSIPPGDTVDLGAMEAVPKGEFFGASLWQIVKALKSPFKSIMKFALLDTYLAAGGTDVLLCNRVKRAMCEGRRDFWNVDPYAVLYREIEGHYARQGNGEARELLRLAFEEKTGFSEQGRTTGRPADLHGFSYLEYFFPYALDEGPGGAPVPSADKARPTFARLHDLGQKVARFMFGTYTNIQRDVAGLDEETTITAEDLTRLGRRIIGQFQPKEGKILHTPFVASPGSLFSSIELACEGIPGTPPTWVARGEHPKRDAGKSEYEELRRDKNPVALLAWLVANQVWASGQPLMGKDLRAPISVPDLRALAEDMAAALPLHDVFEPEIEESLRDEELTRAFISINFQTDRDIREYRDVTLTYATNWGELFCITAPKGLKLLEKDVRGFLAANTKARIGAEVVLTAFLPNRSQAPRPVLV